MKLIRSKLTATQLDRRVNAYFTYIKGDKKKGPGTTVAKKKTTKSAKDDSIWQEITIGGRQPEPPTLTGLTLFIGFNSLEELDEFQNKPRYAAVLKRARLKIQAEYEKKLHLTSSAGAIFALKTLLGCNDEKPTVEPVNTTLEIKILEAGPALAHTEKEVIL